jgi:kynurenine formamidase
MILRCMVFLLVDYSLLPWRAVAGHKKPAQTGPLHRMPQKLVRRGIIMTAMSQALAMAKVYDLEQPRFAGMPIHPSHRPGYHYALHRRHGDTYQPQVHGPRSSASGMLTMMEHSGTHIDALSHQAHEMKLFGGIPAGTAETPSGFKKHGIETVPPLLGRGILLDVAGWRKLPRLPRKGIISADDLRGTAAAQGVKVQPGDVLLVRTGYGAIWKMTEEAEYLDAAGVGKSGTLWAAEQGVRAVGADNMAWDAVDERDPETGATLFAHDYLLPQRGIYIIENLNLEELARDRCHEFAFIGIPLKFQGATGSPLRPLALV